MSDWWTSTRIGMAGFLASTPGAAMLASGELETGAAALAAAVLASGAGLTWRWRQDSLPLELSPVALVGELNGCRVVRFRARLGRGRVCQHPNATVRYQPEGGEAVELDVLDPGVAQLVGPFTVVAFDRDDVMSEPGTLEANIRVQERDQVPQVDGRWRHEELQTGRFAGGWRHRGGKLELDAATWDAVQVPETP